jgi:uncharacterized protein YehS (DUF1456 family)
MSNHELAVKKYKIIAKNKIKKNTKESLLCLYDTTINIEKLERIFNDDIRRSARYIYEIDIEKINKDYEKYDIYINNEKLGKFIKTENSRFFQIGNSNISITKNNIIITDGYDYSIGGKYFHRDFNFGDIIYKFIFCIQKNADIVNKNIDFKFKFELVDIDIDNSKYRDVCFDDNNNIKMGSWVELDKEKSAYDTCPRLFRRAWYERDSTYMAVSENTAIRELYEYRYSSLFYNYKYKYTQYLLDTGFIS